MKFTITEEEKNKILKMYIVENPINFVSTEQNVELDTLLGQAGLKLTPEETKEIQPECELEIPSEHEDIINQIKSKIEVMDKNQLVGLLKQILPLNKKVNEQIAPVIIAGVTVPGVAIAAVVGIVILLVLIKIAKLIFPKRSSSGYYGTPRSCKNRYKLMDKFIADLR